MASNDGGQQGQTQQQTAPQQVTTSAPNNGQQQVQVQQQASPSPQQIQIQQATTAQNIQHAQQQHQANQGQAMQQVQLIPQTQAYNLQNLQHLLNQGQIIMPSGIFNPNMNSQIQVIQTKPIQNQFTHMLQQGTTSYAIPTSGANNSVGQYIIGNFSQSSPIQLQHQQGKPGEMTKVIGGLQQGLWASPQTLFTTGGQNSFLIRGAHPEQMYIQPQMTSNGSQQFSMQPLQTANAQLPNTSIAPVTSAQVQQNIQGNLQHQQQQQQQTQSQPLSIQPQPNVVTIKAPANLQPKPPPLQIQPNTQQQATHQIQQQHQLQPQFQVTVNSQNQQQIQMIPQGSTANMIPQSISITQSPQATQGIQQAQQQNAQNQNQPRHLTILPHQGNQTLQNQPVQIIQQQGGQLIRPNFGSGLTMVSSQPQTTQPPATNGVQSPQPRQKIRKSTVPRAGAGSGTTGTIIQPPRPGTTIIAVPSPQQPKQFLSQQQQQPHLVNISSTRIPIVTTSQNIQQPQQMVQHLKTINISAIHPNLPDATITPLNPNPQALQQQHQSGTSIQSVPQSLQVFTTQVPSPNVSITPATPSVQTTPKKTEEAKESRQNESKNDTEKENNNSTKSVSTNGTTIKDEPEEVVGKQKLPKAMVKPQVLTHVIEGFVIQEAAEPFPMPKNVENDEPPKKKSAQSGEMGKCEMCGKIDLKAKFKKNKRFCSSQCAKSMKAAQQQAQATSTSGHAEEKKKGRRRKWGEGVDGNCTDETSSSVETSANEDQPMDVDESRVNPVKWGVSEVVDFVRSLPGCSEYAEDFAVQEIDGQALLLLKEDHLMSAIGMKLGPALKLCAKIESLRLSNSNGDASVPSKV